MDAQHLAQIPWWFKSNTVFDLFHIFALNFFWSIPDNKFIYGYSVVSNANLVREPKQNFPEMLDLLKSCQKKHITYWLYPSAYDPINTLFFLKRSCYEEKCNYYRSFSKLFGFWCLFKLSNMGSRLGANWSWLSRYNTRKVKRIILLGATLRIALAQQRWK